MTCWKILDDMGHGDQLLPVDRSTRRSEREVGHPLGRGWGPACGSSDFECVALDSFIDHPLERMEVEDDPVKTTSLQNDLLALASESEGRSLEYGVIPRLDFYQRASAAYAVVHTLEDQPYGCFILHKGVIF